MFVFFKSFSYYDHMFRFHKGTQCCRMNLGIFTRQLFNHVLKGIRHIKIKEISIYQPYLCTLCTPYNRITRYTYNVIMSIIISDLKFTMGRLVAKSNSFQATFGWTKMFRRDCLMIKYRNTYVYTRICPYMHICKKHIYTYICKHANSCTYTCI